VNWWNWKDQPVKKGKYLVCWCMSDNWAHNMYEVHYYDGEWPTIPLHRSTPHHYATITHPQEENALRELHEMT
jgi:hypothetical protein